MEKPDEPRVDDVSGTFFHQELESNEQLPPESGGIQTPSIYLGYAHLAFASHLQAEQRKYQRDIVMGLAVPRKLLGGEPNYSGRRGVSPVWKVMIGLIGFRKFQEALMRVARAMAQFSVALVSRPDQESAYLVHHKRLPGSLRTSRLRKKRRTRVECWYRKIKKRSKA